MDSLIFLPDSTKPVKVEETAAAFTDSLSVPPPGSEDITSKEATGEFQNDVEVENVERPVDLYKVRGLLSHNICHVLHPEASWFLLSLLIVFLVQAIFSDDSDDEEENSSPNQVEDPKIKNGTVSTTLNRLIAGDFLELLGKELGLDVPPDLPNSENKTRVSASQKDTVNSNKGNDNTLEVENTLIETLSSEKNRSGKVELGKVAQVDRHRNQSSRSPVDERNRKHSRRHRNRSSNSDSETTSSEDYRDLHRSRSKGREKGSSREKSSRRKHSKHRKHERGDSLSRSHHGSDKERRDAKREKRRTGVFLTGLDFWLWSGGGELLDMDWGEANLNRIWTLKPLCFTEEGEVIMAVDRKRLVVYNLEQGTHRWLFCHLEVKQTWGNPGGFKVAVYVESLVSPRSASKGVHAHPSNKVPFGSDSSDPEFKIIDESEVESAGGSKTKPKAKNKKRDSIAANISSALSIFAENGKRRVDVMEKKLHCSHPDCSGVSESISIGEMGIGALAAGMKECQALLNTMEYLDEDSYNKVLEKLHGDVLWRQMFLDMREKRRIA
ncbi:hypothetical protein RHSIM_Rhsim08G0139300 [Rhododendron simsii]|uniref:Uncharacterized protein n=1 Tax=Rhododendron simsii TaxID=118357 RepID=A0A834LI76_RHOSS|nr:hypothetical protein RHSIM_Rhsim08G0139300 [Rhododendron simsii]